MPVHFDCCYCISLDRRPDRWEAFCERLPKDWPFPTPQRFSAYDGRDALIIPENWKATTGAFGCLLSHRVLLRQAAEAQESVLILEDDVTFRPWFAERAQAMREAIHDNDWDLLFFGGQHILPSTQTELCGVRRCVKTQRTQAYAVSARGASLLLPISEAADNHIDVYYARAMHAGTVKAYSAHPWLCGQSAGTSDVFGSKQPARTVDNFWDEVL
jgi:GR25 family glycosyltransferase involved in LPS biosynthesis